MTDVIYQIPSDMELQSFNNFNEYPEINEHEAVNPIEDINIVAPPLDRVHALCTQCGSNEHIIHNGGIRLADIDIDANTDTIVLFGLQGGCKKRDLTYIWLENQSMSDLIALIQAIVVWENLNDNKAATMERIKREIAKKDALQWGRAIKKILSKNIENIDYSSNVNIQSVLNAFNNNASISAAEMLALRNRNRQYELKVKSTQKQSRRVLLRDSHATEYDAIDHLTNEQINRKLKYVWGIEQPQQHDADLNKRRLRSLTMLSESISNKPIPDGHKLKVSLNDYIVF
jgi:hypothetical protein